MKNNRIKKLFRNNNDNNNDNNSNNNDSIFDVILCKSIISKTIGLMFHKKLNDNEALMFVFNKEEDPLKIMLHNFFVFFSLDLIFLDRNLKVIEIKENFKPFTCYLPKNKAMYIIETNSGNIDDKNIQLEDRFFLK